MMKENLLNLIRERTNKVALAVEMLKEKYGDIKFVAANKDSEQVPKKGFLDTAKTVPYNLHGKGIDVDFGGERIEFDFNFNTENHTGFNRWWLNAFLSRHKTEFYELADLSIEDIQSLLVELERENQIRFDKAENLYYLPDESNNEAESKARQTELALQ
jgi:hypothetical protein